jgi:hypothetical protein
MVQACTNEDSHLSTFGMVLTSHSIHVILLFGGISSE